MTTHQKIHTHKARCALCGQWAKADTLGGFHVVACTGILCPSHGLGIVGRGHELNEAFSDFLDKVDLCLSQQG